jgi:hypothetical protein
MALCAHGGNVHGLAFELALVRQRYQRRRARADRDTAMH